MEPGDDILLSVITGGRHGAIDLRLVDAENDNEPANKLNLLIETAHRIWEEIVEIRITIGHLSNALKSMEPYGNSSEASMPQPRVPTTNLRPAKKQY